MIFKMDNTNLSINVKTLEDALLEAKANKHGFGSTGVLPPPKYVEEGEWERVQRMRMEGHHLVKGGGQS